MLQINKELNPSRLLVVPPPHSPDKKDKADMGLYVPDNSPYTVRTSWGGIKHSSL